MGPRKYILNYLLGGQELKLNEKKVKYIMSPPISIRPLIKKVKLYNTIIDRKTPCLVDTVLLK